MKKNTLLSVILVLISFCSSAQTQNNWFFCNKCSCLNFGETKGVCAAGGEHYHDSKTSGNYVLSYNTSTCKGQNDWRYCNKCSSLFFGGANGTCAAGGLHYYDNKTSGNYILCYTKNGKLPDSLNQSEWYFCNKCACLFFGQFDGVCAKGGKHFQSNETSGNYVINHL